MYKPLWFGAVFFISGLTFYMVNFGAWPWWDNISDDRAVWGQFGDFMGGLVNPLLALLTVWLFTKSLHQNGDMLKAAREELQLSREEIARGVIAQQSVEVALNAQITLASAEKDFNAAISMMDVLRGRKTKLDEKLDTKLGLVNSAEMEIERNVLLKQIEALETVIENGFDNLIMRLSGGLPRFH